MKIIHYEEKEMIALTKEENKPYKEQEKSYQKPYMRRKILYR